MNIVIDEESQSVGGKRSDKLADSSTKLEGTPQKDIADKVNELELYTAKFSLFERKNLNQLTKK